MKASSAITVANKVVEKLCLEGAQRRRERVGQEEIIEKSMQLAVERSYPESIAKEYYYPCASL